MTQLRILVTGSRDWSDEKMIRRALYRAYGKYSGTLLADRMGLIRDTVVVHGGARGADQLAAIAATSIGMKTEHHPADWQQHGRAAGPIRNREMVDAGADVCLAFPIGASPGTRGCMKLAEEAGIPVDNIGDELAEAERVRRELDGLAEEAAELNLYEQTAEPRETR